MGRFRHRDWNTKTPEGSTHVPNDEVKIALLMDIRDQIYALNRALGCDGGRGNGDIVQVLRRISRNTAKPKKKKAKVVK